jgi:putative acetyltransferase
MIMSLQDGIFPVAEADYPRVVEVWEASVRATHHFVAAADIEFFRPIVRDVLPNLEIYCMRDSDNTVVGYVAVADKEVQMLFIHPDYRGQGVGRKLLTYAIEQLGANRLDVNEQNEQAVGFYKRMGLEVVGRSELDGFGKPYPLLHMRVVDKEGSG